MSYDAFLLLSFGGPEKRDEVIPFLENVLRGRNVPRERMLEVAEHYYHFGGRSPINDQNRALIAALEKEFAVHGVQLPIYWGTRNWHPLLADTVRQMRADGVRRALAFATSAFGSYSGCRQYLEDIDRARAEVGEGAPEIQKLRTFHNHPGFIEAMADYVSVALQWIPEEKRVNAPLVFTAHSIPESMAATSPYVQQLHDACELVAGRLHRDPLQHNKWTLVYQSRSGAPGQPWLGPDICDWIRARHTEGGLTHMVIAPIGFLSDHMEVRYDLDQEAGQLCESLGIQMVRAATVGVHPAFVSMIRELVAERTEGAPPRTLGSLGPSPDVCAAECCPPPPRRPPSAR